MTEFTKLNIDKSSWVLTQLGDLAEEISKREDNPSSSDFDRFVGLEHFVSGELKIKDWKPTDDLVSAAKVFKSGDILFARRNAYLKRASMVEFNGVCSGDAFVLRENHEMVVPGFLAFVVNSTALWEYANSNAAGTMSKRVKWRDLAEYQFLLPPKDQQAKIAELLWAMDDVVEKEKEVLEKLLINERVNINDLFFHKDIGQCKKSKLGYIPNNWDCVTLQELLEKGSIVSHLDGNHGSFYPKAEEFVDSGVPYISANCIENGEINLNNAKYLTIERASVFTKGVACDGDILLAHNATVGPVCMLKTQLEKIILSTTLTYYRVNDKDVSSKYLYYYMQSDLFQKQLKRVMSQSTRNQVPITTQRKLYFIIPPLNEQNLIATSINQVKTPLESSKGHIESSMQLQKSLINEIFTV